MRVKDLLKLKGNVLYTVKPDCKVIEAARLMDNNNIWSLVVIENTNIVGIITFREIIQILSQKNGLLGDGKVREIMNSTPLTCTYETDINEVRRLMIIGKHTYYLPVLSNKCLMGVISLYDIVKAVTETTNFENQMLKAYIRYWPEENKNNKLQT